MLAMLAHKVIDGFTKQGLDAGISVKCKLVQRPAYGWAEIADHRFLPLTRVSGP